MGAAVPGMVDQRTGQVLWFPGASWQAVDLRPDQAAATGLPVEIENSAVPARWRSGSSRRSRAAAEFRLCRCLRRSGCFIVINGELLEEPTLPAVKSMC